MKKRACQWDRLRPLQVCHLAVSLHRLSAELCSGAVADMLEETLALAVVTVLGILEQGGEHAGKNDGRLTESLSL